MRRVAEARELLVGMIDCVSRLDVLKFSASQLVKMYGRKDGELTFHHLQCLMQIALCFGITRIPQLSCDAAHDVADHVQVAL